jgi:uncharacterized membrane protein
MTARTALRLFALAILLVMVFVTVRAGLAQSLWDAWDSYAANPWAVATLYDAYSGFFIFFAYVAWRERSLASRLVWFLLIMGLGNMATAAYLLIALARLGPDEPAAAILTRERRRVSP